MASMNLLREIDAEIIRHVIDRGKLWEKRKKIIKALGDSPELPAYQEELREWLGEMSNDSNDGSGDE